MTLEVPGHLPWPVHRVATSGYYRDSFVEIMTQWSLADVINANDVIDAYEDAKARAAEEDRGGGRSWPMKR